MRSSTSRAMARRATSRQWENAVLLDALTSRHSLNPGLGDSSLDCTAQSCCYGLRSCRGPCEARSTWRDSAGAALAQAARDVRRELNRTGESRTAS